MKTQLLLLLIITYCLSFSVHYDNPTLFALSLLFLAVFSYYHIFVRYCDVCNMKYDSLQHTHCCICMRNYINYTPDFDSNVNFYNHCCICKSHYDENEEHDCKIKQD